MEIKLQPQPVTSIANYQNWKVALF